MGWLGTKTVLAEKSPRKFILHGVCTGAGCSLRLREWPEFLVELLAHPKSHQKMQHIPVRPSRLGRDQEPRFANWCYAGAATLALVK